VLIKPFLEELISMGLLIKINNGIKSAKNKSTLHIKVKIPWILYSESCNKLVMSSSSAKLSKEANTILIAAPYAKYFRFTNSLWETLFCMFTFLFYKSYQTTFDSSDRSQKIDSN